VGAGGVKLDEHEEETLGVEKGPALGCPGARPSRFSTPPKLLDRVAQAAWAAAVAAGDGAEAATDDDDIFSDAVDVDVDDDDDDDPAAGL
jgi:hypothetical protein